MFNRTKFQLFAGVVALGASLAIANASPVTAKNILNNTSEYTVPNAMTAGPAIDIQRNTAPATTAGQVQFANTYNAAPGKIETPLTARSTASPALTLALTTSTFSTKSNVGISAGATMNVSPHAIKDNGGTGIDTAVTSTNLDAFTIANNGNIARGSAINTSGNLAVNNTGNDQINTTTSTDHGATTNGVASGAVAASSQTLDQTGKLADNAVKQRLDVG